MTEPSERTAPAGPQARAPSAPSAPSGSSARFNLVSSVVSQGLVAGASLVLQWIALWQLGRSGLGAYSILNAGWLVVITAVHTGWVGDPLTLIDRHDHRIRPTLFRAAGWGALLAAVVAAAGSWLTAPVPWATALLFGVAMCAWVIEETFRRLMMANFMFRSLALNDTIYGVVAVGVALVLAYADRITLAGLVAAMLCGSIAAIGAAGLQVPRAEWAVGSSGPSDWPRLSRIAVWRSGQLTLRPATLLAVRVGIEAVSSAAVLGLFETGRLAVAAVMTMSNGLGAFALPYFKRRFDAGNLSAGAVIRSVGLAAGAGFVALPTMAVMVPLVGAADDGRAVPVALFVSWAVFAVASCANTVAVNALAVWGKNRGLFLARILDAAIAVPCALALAAAGWVEWVPLALVGGMMLGTGGLFVASLRGRTGASPVAGEPAAEEPSKVAEEPAAGETSKVSR